MARKICLANQKGGVGKTTTAVNLSAGLGLAGKKVLLVDLDPQGNASTSFGIAKAFVEKDVNGIFKGEHKIEECIMDVKATNVSVIPSQTSLAGIDSLNKNTVELKNILQKEIERIESQYDYIIFDCPPSLGTLSVTALSISNETIIPVQTEFFALEGITQLIVSIKLTQQSHNPNLKVGGILLTMFDSRTGLSHEVQEEVRKHFGNVVFKTVIPRQTKLAEAPSHGQSIFEFDGCGRGAAAYKEFIKEVIANE